VSGVLWLAPCRSEHVALAGGGEGYLGVEANPADDTIEVSFDRLKSPPVRHWATDSMTHNANEYYFDVLGMTSTWRRGRPDRAR
jgi:hypothetical protein